MMPSPPSVVYKDRASSPQWRPLKLGFKALKAVWLQGPKAMLDLAPSNPRRFAIPSAKPQGRVEALPFQAVRN